MKWRTEREGIVRDATDVNKMLISDKNTRLNLKLIYDLKGTPDDDLIRMLNLFSQTGEQIYLNES